MGQRRSKVLRNLGLIWLAWLLLGNLALNTGLAQSLINRKPEAFQLHWRHGVTLFPGQAWLWQVQAQGHVRRVQWQAQAERASGRLALLPLLLKQVRLPMARAHQARFELDRVEHDRLPPEPQPGGWTISIGMIRSDSVLGARFGDVHLDGEGQARFGVVKQLRGGPMEILPSSGTLHAARLRVGDELVADALALQAQFTLPRHRRERAPGLARLGLADARLKLEGRSAGLAIRLDETGSWRTHLVPLADLSDDQSGTIDIDLGLEQGRLLAGSRFELDLPLQAQAGADEHWAERGIVQLQVDENIALHLHLPPPPGDGGEIDARVHLTGVELPFACMPPDPAAAELGPSCEFDRDLSHQWARLAGELRLRWHFDSLRWLGPLLVRAPWLHLDGAGEVDADLRIEAGSLAAGSRLQVPALSARLDVLDNHIEGTAHADARIEADGHGGTRTDLDLVIERFEMAPVAAPDQVQVRGRDLRLTVQSDGALACLWPRGNDDDNGNAPCPAAGMVGKAPPLHAHLRFDEAEVPALTAYNRYLPAGGLRLLGGSGRLSGDLHLDTAGEVGNGTLVLAGRGARMAIADLELSGDLRLDARLQRADLEQRSFDLSGTRLRLDRVQAVDGERMLGRDWWLDAQLQQGTVQWQQPLAVDAQVQARARDVGLLLGLFAQRSHYPRWALRLLDAGQAQVEGRLRLVGDELFLQPLHAHNDRFDVRARLRVRERKPSGDLLLGWGRLKAGLELANGERNWHLRGAQTWFDARGSAQ